jgi:hypothetical protein
VSRNYAKNHERINQKRREDYAEDPNKVLEQNRKWREANRSHINEKKREKYAANPEKILEQNRKWYEANRGDVNERRRMWWLECNAERIEEAQALKPVLDQLELIPENIDKIEAMAEYIQSDNYLTHVLDWYWLCDALDFLERN